MHLLSDYPWPYWLLCLLLGAAYAAALYLLGRRTDSLSRPLRWGLAALRCLTVSLIVWLLLAPMVKRTTTQKERPIILVAQDNSQSIALAADSLDLDPLLRELAKDYDLRLYTFGEALSESQEADYHETCTDMAAALSELRSRYENRNVGALILASDGLYNRGLSPLHVCQGLPYPVYAIAQGDTTVRRDAAIAHLRYNRLAYLGNQFPIEVTVSATKLKGEKATLSLSHNGKTLYSNPIAYSSDDYTLTLPLQLTADQAGLQTYTLHLSSAPGETSDQNNTRTLTIEVIDGHQRVAIVAAAPHPDVAALRHSLEECQNYEVESFLASDFRSKAADYDLLILHNLPSQKADFTLPAGVPALFVVGMQTDLGRLGNLHLGLEISTRLQQFNECTPLVNSAFPLFLLTDEVKGRLERFPPLTSPFGDYRLAGNTQTLLTARIGTIQSGQPLMAFSQKEGTRYGFICGEGLWRWRMADYGSNQSFEAFNTLINKAVIYTAQKSQRDRFHVACAALFHASEAVTLEATLYNDNYELVNQPEVELEVPTLGNYLFNRTGNGYSLNLGTLDPGTYTYRASTTLNAQLFTATGTFTVEESHLEALTLVADHTLLNTLSQTTGGQLISPSEMATLPELLRQRDDIKTLLYSHTRYTQLLSLPWLFLLIVLLLGIEWITRKYNGEI